MTWNVLFGGEDRIDRILELIARVKPDLLILQECLDWDDRARLHAVAGAMNIPDDDRHAHLALARPRGSGKRYHVAVLSRAPSELVAVHANPSFIGHCIAEVRLLLDPPVRVFGTHFDSHSENLRFVEARYLRSVIDARAFASEPFLLAGDLNALSRRDPYPIDLADRVAHAGVDKYGHPPRFEVIDELESFGWVDALRALENTSEWITAERDRGGVHIDYRTDYVFTSPALAAKLNGVEVIHAGGVSDHHALVAHFSD